MKGQKRIDSMFGRVKYAQVMESSESPEESSCEDSSDDERQRRVTRFYGPKRSPEVEDPYAKCEFVNVTNGGQS